MKKWIGLAFPGVFLLFLAVLVVWSYTSSRQHQPQESSSAASGLFTDPVCNMEIADGLSETFDGATYLFCTERCLELFRESPERYLENSCLVCESQDIFTPVGDTSEFTAIWQGSEYSFCTEAHRAAFQRDPAGYFLHSMWGIPNWLYYSSIAFIMLLSFVWFEVPKEKPSTESRAGQGIGVVNVLRLRGMRSFIKNPFSRFLLRLAVVVVFVVIIAAGLFGSQISSDNIAPLLTWTIWWGGLVLVILYAGSAWCYVCPWDAISDWLEGLRLWGVKKDGLGLGLRVPKRFRNVWIAIGLFILLTWLELGFGVTMNPRATAWLALAITCAAFMSVFVFERKAFCRYACPVGRIIGIYSLFSPAEVRAEDPEVCRKCRTQSCYKGNAQGEACPTSLYIPAMRENTNCLNCMECVKSCESDNVALNVRPWGADFSVAHRVRMDEAMLALVLLILAAFHGLTMTGVWRDLLARTGESTGLGYTASFSLLMSLLMVAPTLVYALLARCSFALGRSEEYSYRDYFVRYAYALLPIALFYHLAHNSEHLLMEGPKIVALLSDPLGRDWDLFQTAGITIGPLVTLKTLWFIQVVLVVMGHVYSLWAAKGVAHRMFPAGKATTSQLPMVAAMILFSLVSLWLLKQPMEMRTSAM